MAHPSVSNILKFANSIDFSSTDIVSQIRPRIACFPVENIQPKQRPAFEARGTELWNVATRHTREDGEIGSERSIKVALLRVFAFGMLDSAASSRTRKSKSAETCSRMLNVALKCIKACIDAHELDFASKVASRAAAWLEEGQEVLPEDAKKKLGAEYFIWRMALAWKQDKLDVAEHMYEKFRDLSRGDPECAEELSDVLYELGKDLCDRKQFELAATWLGRALESIDEEELDRLSEDASDLRLAIMQKLVKSLLSMKTPDSIIRAKHIIGIVDHSYSDKLIAALLKLEVLAMEEKPDATEYFEVISKMTRTITLTRPNFKTIMHHIHKLKKLNALLACRTLDELIKLRLSQDRNEEFIERACMLRIWITLDNEESTHDLDGLDKVLGDMHDIMAKAFSSSATHAAQTLLWPHIEKAYNNKQYTTAEAYCALALHKVFEKCGELNASKIGRKWMMCALARANAPDAREIYFRFSEQQRNAPETRHLAFKIAIRVNDAKWAAESLELIARQSGKDASRLYACVLDAIQVGDDKQAYQALSMVLRAYDRNEPQGVNLPALLRCMTRLIRSHLKDAADPAQLSESMENLCLLFETAAEDATISGSSFDTNEISWFSKNSYNLAIECMDKVSPQVLIRLCRSCSRLIDRLERDTPAIEKSNLKLRQIFCEYLAITAVIVLARNEDDIDRSHELYTAIAQHGAKLRAVVAEEMEAPSLNKDVKADLVAKHMQSIKFELEAALRLKGWDALPDLFNLCWRYKEVRKWSTIADIAFSIHDELCQQEPEMMQRYQTAVLMFIERVLNMSWSPSEPIEKLAKHLRCFFHLTLTKDDGLASKCIDQVINFVKHVRYDETPYPQMELEWMAATAFNHAVSCFCVKDDPGCQLWAEKALMVGDLIDDNGALSGEMRTKYAQLKFDEGS